MTGLRHLLRLAAETDAEARLENGIWQTRCLHCRAHLAIRDTGEPLGTTTLEHIVPRSWFNRRAAEDLTAAVGGPADARNLALACARCNQQKGRGPDAAGPSNGRAREVVRALIERRGRRLRDSR